MVDLADLRKQVEAVRATIGSKPEPIRLTQAEWERVKHLAEPHNGASPLMTMNGTPVYVYATQHELDRAWFLDRFKRDPDFALDPYWQD